MQRCRLGGGAEVLRFSRDDCVGACRAGAEQVLSRYRVGAEQVQRC